MKYIIKFRKKGRIRYISHLDMQSVFLRLFRIIGVKPLYSNGFNPHPKMSFALPLSLGFASEAEYLELETEKESGFDIDMVTNRLNECIPEGLSIDYITEKPDSLSKKLASYVDCAAYTIKLPIPSEGTISMINEFMSQDDIIVSKTNKKSGKTKEINIKNSIHNLKIDKVDDNNILLSTLLHSGSDSVLNPIIMIESFLEFSGLSSEKSTWSVTRDSVFCNVNGVLSNVDQILL